MLQEALRDNVHFMYEQREPPAAVTMTHRPAQQGRRMSADEVGDKVGAK